MPPNERRHVPRKGAADSLAKMRYLFPGIEDEVTLVKLAVLPLRSPRSVARLSDEDLSELGLTEDELALVRAAITQPRSRGRA